MRVRVALPLLVLVLVATLAAQQSPAGDRAASLVAMSKLKNLAGEWHGSGWVVLGRDRREEFGQTETITPKLDGLVLTIDGLGKSSADGHIVHQAFGVLFWDQTTQQYR